MACLVASWSKDPKRQTGCILTDELNCVVSTGYNGYPRHIDVPPTDEDRLAITLHAELNALLQAHRRAVTAYIWPYGPCSQCMAALAQAGIERVVSKRMPDAKWRPDLSLYIAEQKQIEMILLEDYDTI